MTDFKESLKIAVSLLNTSPNMWSQLDPVEMLHKCWKLAEDYKLLLQKYEANQK